MTGEPYTPVPKELLQRLARGELNVTQYAIAGWLIERRWHDGGAAAFTLEELRHAIGYRPKVERLRRHLVGLGYGTLEPARGSRRYWRWTAPAPVEKPGGDGGDQLAIEDAADPGSPRGSTFGNGSEEEPGSPRGAAVAPPTTAADDAQTLTGAGAAAHAGSTANGSVAPPEAIPLDVDVDTATARARETDERAAAAALEQLLEQLGITSAAARGELRAEPGRAIACCRHAIANGTTNKAGLALHTFREGDNPKVIEPATIPRCDLCGIAIPPPLAMTDHLRRCAPEHGYTVADAEPDTDPAALERIRQIAAEQEQERRDRNVERAIGDWTPTGTETPDADAIPLLAGTEEPDF